MGKPQGCQRDDSRNILTDRHLCFSCVVRGCIRAWKEAGMMRENRIEGGEDDKGGKR
jgi:hypothetical protein